MKGYRHLSSSQPVRAAGSVLFAMLLLFALAFTGCASQETQEADSSEQTAYFDDSATEEVAVVEDDETPQAASAQLTGSDVQTVGDFLVKGGTSGTDYELSGTILRIKTSTPLTVQNVNQAAATSYSIEIAAGVKADLTLDGVNISLTANAPINMITNVMDTADGSRATNGNQIRNKTTLHLTIADGSVNTLRNSLINDTNGSPAIRCGWGSILIIDDARTNIVQGGSKFNLDDIVTPVDGVVGADATLLDGTKINAGDPLSVMESANPGTLYAYGGSYSAAIGSGPQENAGTLIFNGGNVTSIASYGWSVNISYSYGNGSGIGGGAGGSGTIITINGGNVTAEGASCGTGIGAGFGYFGLTSGGHHYCTPKDDAIAVTTSITSYEQGFGYSYYAIPQNEPLYYYSANGVEDLANNTINSAATPHFHTVAGDITINGGYVFATSPAHGNAIGQACGHGPASNRGHIIRITGGTLITHVKNLTSTNPYLFAIGARMGYTLVTGGSVYVETGGSAAYNGKVLFQGLGGTAYNTHNIASWDDVIAKAGGDPNVDSTKTLPASDKVYMVTVNLAAEGITDNEIVDWQLYVQNMPYAYGAPHSFKNGILYLWLPSSATEEQIAVDLSYKKDDGTVAKVDTLFREPGAGAILKRYVDFELDQEYLTSLNKDYDGLPLEAYDLASHAVTTKEEIPKTLNVNSACSFTYQRYDAVDGNPIGLAYDRTKTEAADAGVLLFTMTSNQYSTSDPNGFGQSYWGHRATGWAEIYPVDSQVSGLDATWVESNKPGSEHQSAEKLLRVSADIKGAEGTAATCKYPQGSVQLYVDGKPVGEPIELVFSSAGADLMALASSIALLEDAPAAATPSATNATIVASGSGSYTHFSYDFSPAETDYLVPDATDDGKHIVSLQYIPLKNYNESMSPDPDKAEDWVEVAIDPIDPDATVEKGTVTVREPDPDDPDDEGETIESAPGVEITSEAPKDDPDSEARGGKLVEGTIKTAYSEPTADNPYPGRVVLALDTPSSGAVTVTTSDGQVLHAEVLTDEEGNPVRDADGKLVVVVDPQGAGHADLIILQEANGAYTSTKFVYDVEVEPDLSIAPVPATSKSVRNLTHPKGPVQIGDVLEYSVSADNAAKGSLWKDVTVSDPVPEALAIDEGSITLSNPGAAVETAATKASGAPAAPGEYSLEGNTLSVFVGDVYGVGSATVTFQATVKDDARADADLTNIASSSGTRPADPDDPASKDGPLASDPSAPVVPEGGGHILPADPDLSEDILTVKSVENKTHPSADSTAVGDTLIYTIVVENKGAASTCLMDAFISDPLPQGIVADPSTFTLIPAGSSEPVEVDASAYDAASNRLAVYVGNLYGQTSATLTFEATVTADALSAPTRQNIAYTYGTLPSTTTGDPETGEGANPEAGTKVPGSPANPEGEGDDVVLVGSTDPAEPPTLEAGDPADSDIHVTKAVENLTAQDGTTHVGDIVRYTVTASNTSATGALMDAVIRDIVPEGIEPQSGSIKIELPNNTSLDVADSAYDPQTRVLAVNAGHLYPTQQAVLVFDALVTRDAQGLDIGNVADVMGKNPSTFDYSAESPEPGSPATGNSDPSSFDHDVSTPTVYPEGVDANGGVLDLREGVEYDDSNNIANQGGSEPPASDGGPDTSGSSGSDSIFTRALAATGDPAVMGALAIAGLALVAAAFALISRRRRS